MKEWCIPKADADFVAKMEDVLEVYQRPCDPLRPVVCIDETNKQLIEEKRIPCEPGHPEKVDSEYIRNVGMQEYRRHPGKTEAAVCGNHRGDAGGRNGRVLGIRKTFRGRK